MIVYIIVFFFVLFAIKFEKTDYANAYDLSKPKKSDKPKRIFKKIRVVTSYDNHTIKWRRIYISSVLSTVLIFLIIYQRIPSQKELLLYIAIIYAIFALQWSNYTSVISSQASSYINTHLKNLQKHIK